MIQERSYTWAHALVKRKGAPRGIIVHHAAAKIASAAVIHGWHRNRGWAGIAYHFVVRKDGTIERGRPEDTVGGHTLGVNNTLGICCEGNFQDETMGQAQYDALVWLVRDLKARYGALALTRHSDHGATACPGRKFPWTQLVTRYGMEDEKMERLFKVYVIEVTMRPEGQRERDIRRDLEAVCKTHNLQLREARTTSENGAKVAIPHSFTDMYRIL